MAYDYKALRTKLLPDIQEALDAYGKARKTNDDQRDIRPLMAILEQIPEADPRIGGHISARTEALNAFEWRLVAKNPLDTAAAEQAINAQARIEEAVEDLMERHSDDVQYGQSATRIKWTLDGPWLPSVDEFLDFSDIERMKDAAVFPGGIAVLEQDGSRFKRMPLIGDTETSYITGTWGRLPGGILKKIMFMEILAHMNIQEWAEFNRRLKGLGVSKYREGSSAESIATAKAAGETIGENNTVVISDDVLFEFVRMVDGIGKDSYDQFLEKLDKRVEFTFRGNASTGELPNHGGSRAAITALMLVGVDILFGDMKRFRRKIDRQLLKQDWLRNVNSVVPYSLPYKMQFVTEEGEDVEKVVRIIEILGRTGYRLDVEEVKRRTGFETLTFHEPSGGGF